MKKINKFSLLLIIVTISFFVGINSVKADDNSRSNYINCYYQLPFIGVKGDRYMKVDDDFPCNTTNGDNAAIDCKTDAKISSDILKLHAVQSGSSYASYDTVLVEFYNYLNRMGKDYSKPVFLYGANDDGLSCSYYYEKYDKNYFTGTYSYRYGCKKGDSDTAHIDNVAVNSEPYFLKRTAEHCPKYLIIRKPNEDSIKYYRQSVKDEFDYECEYLDDELNMKCNDDWYEKYVYYTPGSDKNFYDAKLNFKAYQTSDQTGTTDAEFVNYLKSFYNQPTKNVGKYQFSITGSYDDLIIHDKMILPLYSVGGDILSAEKESDTIDHVMGLYRDTVMQKWVDIDKKLLNNMKNKCGKEWDSYINLKNYKSSFNGGGSKSAQFVSYATGSYSKNSLVDPDNGMSESCWNSRKDFVEYYKLLKILLYSIGARTSGDDSSVENDGSSTNLYIRSFTKDNDTSHASNNIVFGWDDLICSFKYVRYGSDDASFGECGTLSESIKSKQESSKKVTATGYAKDLFYKDKCAYKCFGTLTSDDMLKKTDSWFQSMYSTCTNSSTGAGNAKKDGTSYNDCVKAMKECGGSTYNEKKTSCESMSGGSTTALEECLKSYDTTITSSSFNTCMDEKIPEFSTKSKEMYDNASAAYDKAVDSYTVDETYKFEDAGLLTFDFKVKEYKPKCKDVEFLTSIWGVVIVLAPFLLIIYSTYDYIKVVMAGDEEKMKLARKKVPKRVIALVILLVFPVILKMLVSTFGTHGSQNTKYIRCILSRDHGDSDEDDDEETEEQEETDENNKK